MKYGRNLVLTSIFMLSNFLSGNCGNTREGLNAKPYGILCSIYNIAANPPTSLYDPSDLEGAQLKIDVINASLSDDAWFGEIDKAKTESELSAEFKAKNGVSRENWERWKRAVTGSKVGERFKKLFSDSQAVKIAQLKFKKIEEQVETIVKRLDEANSSTELKQIKKDFDDAIGESAENDYGIGGSKDRATVCGGASGGKGSKAGANLIVDLLCLCSAYNSATCTGSSACGKECVDTGGASNNWNSGTLKNAKEIWTKLKAGCERTRVLNPTAEIAPEAALGKFLAEIGESKVGTAGSGWKQGLLGTCDGTSSCSSGCDGQISSNQGICVAYGNDPAGWEKGSPPGIEWLAKMKSGLSRFTAIKKLSATIQTDIAHLTMLLTRAEEIYEEAKITLELEKALPEKVMQNQTAKQKPTTPNDKTTAQETNAVNSATIHRFILQWALLI